LQGVAEQKLRGRATTWFFDLYTRGWKCKNPENYTAATKSFKIIACDPMDDTVD